MSIRVAARGVLLMSNMAVPGGVALAALVAVPWSNPSAPTTQVTALAAASAPACYDMVTVAVAGRNDVPHEGSNTYITAADGTRLPASGDYSSHWLDPVINAPKASVGSDSYTTVYIDYPANMDSYEDSVQAGVRNTEQVMRSISASCPDTQFSIVGYSEGSDVVRRVATDVGNQPAGRSTGIDPNQVAGVVILADPGRDAGAGQFPGAQNSFAHPDGYDVAYQTTDSAAPGQGVLPGTAGGFGALSGRVASFCSDGDLTCSAPQNIALLQLAANVGRQLNIDAMQRDGATPANAIDAVTVIGQVVGRAVADIAAQPNWLRSDETFLDVLVKVSDPTYQVGSRPGTPVAAKPGTFNPNQLVDVAYLPAKIRNEVVGFFQDNQNTLQVALNDPYGQTLGEGTGHHFDYWHDEDAAKGRPQSSAQYAAGWLTQLAEQAQRKENVAAAAAAEQNRNAALLAAADGSSSAPLGASDATGKSPAASVGVGKPSGADVTAGRPSDPAKTGATTARRTPGGYTPPSYATVTPGGATVTPPSYATVTPGGATVTPPSYATVTPGGATAGVAKSSTTSSAAGTTSQGYPPQVHSTTMPTTTPDSAAVVAESAPVPSIPTPEVAGAGGYTPRYTPDYTPQYTPDYTPQYTPDYTPQYGRPAAANPPVTTVDAVPSTDDETTTPPTADDSASITTTTPVPPAR